MLYNEIAMNLLHGDHVIHQTKLEHCMVAIAGSHDIGTPCTTLVKGWAYSLYNLCTIDVLGDKGRAE